MHNKSLFYSPVISATYPGSCDCTSYTETHPAYRKLADEEIIMSHTHHSNRENKKKALHTPKEKRAMKLDKKRAAEHSNPEVRIIKGALNPSITS